MGQSAAAKPMSHLARAAPAIPERQGQKTKDERLPAKARRKDSCFNETWVKHDETAIHSVTIHETSLL